MRFRQYVALSVAIIIHFAVAAACPAIDAPKPGDYRYYLPIMTLLVMPGFLAGGVTLAICCVKEFWGGYGYGKMCLIFLASLLCSHMISGALAGFNIITFLFAWQLQLVADFVCFLICSLVRWVVLKLD